MELNLKNFDELLRNFLKAWPVERIASMKLEEYADLNNHNSLCYWLEYGSKYLGPIGNNPLTKFGIWKPKKTKEFKKIIIYDGEFAWLRTKGEKRSQAFITIKKAILEIVHLSINKNWAEIEKVDFHKLVKWKIAFLYSQKQLLPIYASHSLLAISKGLGNQSFSSKSNTYDIQQFILSHRGDEAVENFAYEVYSKFANKPNFYIIGTKYIIGENKIKDIFPEMLKQECIGIGYLRKHDLSNIKNVDPSIADEFVSKNREPEEPSLGKLKSQIKHFLNLKIGDILAVKSKGSYNNLTIIAYALVVARNGKIYEHDPDNFGHKTHIEFLETGFSKRIGFNYADSIHKIRKESDHFNLIFGKYALHARDDDEAEITDKIGVELEELIYDKSEKEYFRRGSAGKLIKQIHNKIQNSFVRYLDSNFPERLRVEHKRRVDVLRASDDCVWLYEIKPYEDAYRCVRESIGQLLDYSFRYSDGKEVKIITVGPNEPDENALRFIEYVKNELNNNYTYLSFNFENDRLTNEY